ncbi:MAG: cysteine desulfurase [Candidatus Acididesulfobacter guangdongensis]|uniref:Cysteine desulfurase n=1 Tax=Acididesulfobacter guangdongensis TaxID=2597225 RepID=A0A519BHI4_ACIG2|nr:MAG: cysteine desulfurase [Candidatus Acididesulfobacter guangdongensis]
MEVKLKTINFDHFAATKMRPEVKSAMEPFFIEEYGNVQSIHNLGDAPREALDKARVQAASLFNCASNEVIFTSSGSESNNLAIKGAAFARMAQGKHIIVSGIEHFSVLNAVKSLTKLGFEFTALPVDKDGFVNPDDVKNAMRKDTILVSITHASNEIGTIQNIKAISEIVHGFGNGAYMHTDANTSCGFIETDVKELGVDMLSAAPHRFYGPKGAGLFYLKKGTRIMPLIDGGVQEFGRRAGTENVAAIAGAGAACELAKNELNKRREHLLPIQKHIIDTVLSSIDEVYLNGSRTNRLPNNINFVIKYIEGESILMWLNNSGIMVASGSACTSKILKSSHVLTAIGVDAALAQGSLLISLGEDNNMEDAKYFTEQLPPIVQKLREMSPLYEEAKSGK